MVSFFHPIFFTLFRLIGAPIIVPSLVVWLTPYNSAYNVFVGVVFLIFCMTDSLDGFIARRYNLVTELGAHLDPIADKFLIFSALIALLSIHHIHVFWVILFIGREIFVMGLRNIALMYKIDIRVSTLARWKTGIQMAALFLIIIISPGTNFAVAVCIKVLLNMAAIFSVISAAFYYRDCICQGEVLSYFE